MHQTFHLLSLKRRSCLFTYPMKTNLPEDYYLSEASHVDINSLQMDADIEESQHLHYDSSMDQMDPDLEDSLPDRYFLSRGVPTQEEHTQDEGSKPDDMEEKLEGDAAGSDGGFSESGNVLDDFRAMFEHKPVWLRAEEAGMPPISPWRQTCDVPFSQRPPPASPTGAGSTHLLPDSEVNSQTTSPSPVIPDNPPSPPPLDAEWEQPVYVVYRQSTPRTPLAMLYSRDQYESEPRWKERVDVACGPDSPIVTQLSHQKTTRDVECQTEPSDEIIPEWLDRSDVEKELRAGREERLKAYIMRFRHSVAAACVDHRRPFNQPFSGTHRRKHIRASTRPLPASPTSGRAGQRLARATKSKARDKIKRLVLEHMFVTAATDVYLVDCPGGSCLLQRLIRRPIPRPGSRIWPIQQPTTHSSMLFLAHQHPNVARWQLQRHHTTTPITTFSIIRRHQQWPICLPQIVQHL